MIIFNKVNSWSLVLSFIVSCLALFIVFTPTLTGLVCVHAATPQLTSTWQSRANASYGLSVVCENSSHITAGSDPTGYYIDVRNTGTLTDTINLSAKIINVTGGSDPDPDEWYFSLDKYKLILEPGEQGQVILNVSTGCGCQNATIATIRVTAQSVNAPSITAYTDTYTQHGAEDEIVELTFSDRQVFSEMIPGDTIRFGLQVYNPQSVTHTYVLSSTKVPSGWTMSFSNEPFELTTNSKKVVQVTAIIPQQNENGEVVFGFFVSSMGDPFVNDSAEFSVNLLPELSVTNITASNPTPEPGEFVEFEVTIENIGVAVARNIEVKIYDDIIRCPETLITKTTVKEIYGNGVHKFNFTWVPPGVGVYNITVHANPSSFIDEECNKFNNNLLFDEIKVQVPPPDETADKPEVQNYMLYIGVGILTVIIVMILCLVYYIKNLDAAVEKTAKKLPLTGGRRSWQKSGYGRSRSKSKTARKIKLDSSSSKYHGKTDKKKNKNRSRRSSGRPRNRRRHRKR